MRLLALDTTTAICRAALIDGDVVRGEYAGAPGRSQAEQLPAALLDLLAAADLTLRDVDAFAVVSGPGSFTGLRIGIATVQGLAAVMSKPVVAVSALDVFGHLGSEGEAAGTHVAAWMDARRGEVFGAVYRVEDRAPFTPERLSAVTAPAVGPPDVMMRGWIDVGVRPAVLAGDGPPPADPGAAVRHKQVLSTAVAAGRIARHRVEAGSASGPADLAPLYVRRPDAVIAREKSGAPR